MRFMSATHVAGPVVAFKKLDRVLQRCVVCGYKLLDCHPSRMAVPEGQDRSLTTFGEADLIQVEEGNPTSYIRVGKFADVDILPDDFCLALVED